MAFLKASGGPDSRRALALVRALPLVLMLMWLASAPQRALAAGDPADDLLLTGPAARSMPLADRIEHARRPDDARLLRRYLLHRHVDDLLGVPPPQAMTVRQAINKAASELGNPVTDTALAARWQQAFNRHVSVRPDSGAYFPASLRALKPAPQEVAIGAWLAVQPESTRHLVAMYLVNRSPTALPFTPLGLELGGLTFACRPRPDDLVGAAEPVMPRNDRFLICEATAPPGSQKPGVRALAASAPQPPTWLWRPAHLESDTSVQALLAAIGLSAQEQQRVQAQQPVNPLAQTSAPAPSPGPALAKPGQSPAPPSLPSASRRLERTWQMALVCLAIPVLGFLGHAFRRRGWSSVAIDVVTLAAAVLVMLPLAALILEGQGSDRAVRFALILFVVGPVVFGGAVIVGLLAKGLRKVLELLEDAGLSFPQAVADALRRALDFTGTASPAQFWSVFMLYGLLAVLTLAVQTSLSSWVMLVMLGVLAVLALPMTALTVRRVRAMTWIEVLALCAVVVYIAADIFVF